MIRAVHRGSGIGHAREVEHGLGTEAGGGQSIAAAWSVAGLKEGPTGSRFRPVDALSPLPSSQGPRPREADLVTGCRPAIADDATLSLYRRRAAKGRRSARMPVSSPARDHQRLADVTQRMGTVCIRASERAETPAGTCRCGVGTGCRNNPLKRRTRGTDASARCQHGTRPCSV